jgi:hypothetical protein
VARSNGRCSQPTLVPSKRLTSVFGVLWRPAAAGVAIGSIIAAPAVGASDPEAELVARVPTFRPARTATKDGLRLAPSGSVVPGKGVTVAEPWQVLDWLRWDELERDQADEQSLALGL